MSFNSYIFIFLFLPLAWLMYFGLNRLGRHESAKVSLLCMSFWFYGYFHPWYLILLIASILVNYTLYKLLTGSAGSPEGRMTFMKPDTGGNRTFRTAVLILGLIFNTGLIFYFKYFAFFTHSLNSLTGTDWVVREVLLPLGISFFTFQQISFLTDAWRGGIQTSGQQKTGAVFTGSGADIPGAFTAGGYSFIDYALYVSFFPQLVAGPIVLHSELIPQLADPERKKPDPGRMARGITLFTLGLAKKLLIADTLGPAVAWGYTWSSELSAAEAALVILSYTFQIYFDFSGYSDMAVGLGLIFNLELPQNFRSPYRALSISDFWKRWHLTLTRFLTGYIYIPLGGNRKGRARTLLNILIVFLISGLWHGANWTFILWGLLHGICMCAERVCTMAFSKNDPGDDPLSRLLVPFRWLVTFILVNLGWALFRADTVSQWLEILTRFGTRDFEIRQELLEFYRIPKIRYLTDLLHLPGGDAADIAFSAALMIAACFFICLVPQNNYERRPAVNSLSLLAISVLFIICVISLGRVSVFLYFNF